MNEYEFLKTTKIETILSLEEINMLVLRLDDYTTKLYEIIKDEESKKEPNKSILDGYYATKERYNNLSKKLNDIFYKYYYEEKQKDNNI